MQVVLETEYKVLCADAFKICTCLLKHIIGTYVCKYVRYTYLHVNKGIKISKFSRAVKFLLMHNSYLFNKAVDLMP